MTRSEKTAIVERLSTEFKEHAALVVADYKGSKTKQLEVLRQNANAAGVKVEVVKNTLASLALNAAGKEGLALVDSNIYIWGEDSIALCKLACEFAKTNDKFAVKSGFLDGEAVDAKHIEALSKMPSRLELLAMLLQVWNAPIGNFTIGLNALKNKKEQN